MTLEKIISGGQTGADQAGWRAAKIVGLATGGWMPKGFKTEAGNRPDFAVLYGAREHPSPEYPPRTELNAGESDGTIWFSFPSNQSGNSAGFRCTHRALKRYEKPYQIVGDPSSTVTKREVRDWVIANNIRVLNIAGNRESKAPGIGEAVERYLLALFESLQNVR